MNRNSTQLEAYFHREIPLTRAMQVRVVSLTNELLVVEAPLSANSNHLRTAFGGSINAVATLAAYGALWVRLADSNHVVISSSTIRFLRPIQHTIRAVAKLPVANSDRPFLRVEVFDGEDDSSAAIFEGKFLIRRNEMTNKP